MREREKQWSDLIYTALFCIRVVGFDSVLPGVHQPPKSPRKYRIYRSPHPSYCRTLSASESQPPTRYSTSPVEVNDNGESPTAHLSKKRRSLHDNCSTLQPSNLTALKPQSFTHLPKTRSHTYIQSSTHPIRVPPPQRPDSISRSLLAFCTTCVFDSSACPGGTVLHAPLGLSAS